MQSDVSAYEVKSERNITPLSESMSAATSLVLVYQNTKPGPVNYLNALVDPRSRETPCAPSYG